MEPRLSMSFRRSRSAQLRAPRLLSSGGSKDGKDGISLMFAGDTGAGNWICIRTI